MRIMHCCISLSAAFFYVIGFLWAAESALRETAAFSLYYCGLHHLILGGETFSHCFTRRPFLQRSSLSCAKMPLPTLSKGRERRGGRVGVS